MLGACVRESKGSWKCILFWKDEEELVFQTACRLQERIIHFSLFELRTWWLVIWNGLIICSEFMSACSLVVGSCHLLQAYSLLLIFFLMIPVQYPWCHTPLYSVALSHFHQEVVLGLSLLVLWWDYIINRVQRKCHQTALALSQGTLAPSACQGTPTPAAKQQRMCVTWRPGNSVPSMRHPIAGNRHGVENPTLEMNLLVLVPSLSHWLFLLDQTSDRME